MKSFRKYEFTPTEWATLRKLIEQTTTTPDGEQTSWKDCAVVEIGFICLEWGQVDDKPVCTKQSDKWAVDILWLRTPLASFKPFEVFPKPTTQLHIIGGYEAAYFKSYCEAYPDSELCVIPEVNEALPE
jgi:hypothetical protein